MNQLTVINHNNQRVLLTAQLAESYGTESDRISKNFHDNKDRFKVGKHYLKLEGDELKQFKNDFRNSELVGKNASVLYLWTEKGAWMHAKSLNTDEAWNAYELLVDDYYNIKQSPQTQLEILQASIGQLVEQERRLSEVELRLDQTEKRQEDIKEVLALNPVDGRKKVTALLNKIAQALGGGSSYQDVRTDSYVRLESRAECNLSIRQTNKRKKMALEGVAKSKIDKVSKLDVIFDDGRLTEIYFAIVKEMAVANRIEVEAS